jgi:hypothetical protein
MASYTFAGVPAKDLHYAPVPVLIDLTAEEPTIKKETSAPAPVASDAEDLYTCPISMELMVDPVMADDGHMYDLEFLVKWFATKSPKTNEPMTKGCVRPWAFHKAYATWAAAAGHPAPVAAGPYGRVVVAVAPVPAPAPRVTGAAMMGVAPAPAPALRVPGVINVFGLPVRHARPSGFGGIDEVSLNCSDTPNIQLRVPTYLAGTTVPVQSLSDRLSRWSQGDARAILKANFPDITIRTDYDLLKGALKGLIRATPIGGNLWHAALVRRWWHVAGGLRFAVALSVEQYIHIRGPTTTVPETLKRLTLPMLKDVATHCAPQLVPSMTTKARAVQVLAAHFIPLCTPVPAQ